jgi:hypothetical protein
MKSNRTQPIVVPDGNTMKKRHANKLTIAGILSASFLGTGLVLYGLGGVSSIPTVAPMAERTDTMYSTKQNPATTHEMLPIDTVSPAMTETATFALG